MNDRNEDDMRFGEDLDALDLGAWEPQVPPADFADRVLARIEAEGPANVTPMTPMTSRPRVRRWGLVAGGAAATLALAAAIALRVGAAPPSSGEAIAQDRPGALPTEVTIGGRALAVLAPGASVKWTGDDVVQSRGDVFYRVEPGARFTVHTPSGDVEVKGTCFGVKVRTNESAKSEETDMQRRDVKSGVIGGALTALAFVAVYEGKVAVSHASERADLAAGETAQLGPDGVRRTGTTAEGEQAFQERAAAQAPADEPLMSANQRLAHQVGEYRSRLEAITQQKTELEAKLKRSEQTLAASQDGSPPPKHSFDLSADDWKQLAKDGTVKYQMPCYPRGGGAWAPSPDKLQALGLSPHDGATIKAAYEHSNQRMWATIKPLCAQAVGSPEVAEKLGPDTCVHLIQDGEGGKEGPRAAMQQVAEMRAGTRPMPGPNDSVQPLVKVFLASTGESKAFEDELAQSFGPEEAHRIVFSDELCMEGNVFRSQPAKKPK